MTRISLKDFIKNPHFKQNSGKPDAPKPVGERIKVAFNKVRALAQRHSRPRDGFEETHGGADSRPTAAWHGLQTPGGIDLQQQFSERRPPSVHEHLDYLCVKGGYDPSILRNVVLRSIEDNFPGPVAAQLSHETEMWFDYNRQHAVPTGDKPFTLEEIDSNKAYAKTYKEVRQRFKQFVPMQKDTIDFHTQKVHQEFYHLQRGSDGVWRKSQGTPSNDVIRKDKKAGNAGLLKNNAMLGAIAMNKKLVCGRCARSDSPDRIHELLLGSAQEAKHANDGQWEGATGVHPGTTPGSHEYQSCIVSFLDLSERKNLATFFHGEPEKPMLEGVRKSVDAVFPEGQTVGCQLPGDDAIGLRKPALIHLPLSGEANRHTLELARRFNEPGAMKLYDQLQESFSRSPDLAKQSFGHMMRGVEGADARRRFFAQEPFPMLPLSSRDSLAVDALAILFNNRDTAGRTYTKPTDSERILHSVQELCQRANTGLHVQCKSGQDRTLTACAALAARTVWEEKNGDNGEPGFYDPREGKQDPGIASGYKLLFTQMANGLGKTPIDTMRTTDDAKGKWKGKNHPTPRQNYYRYSDDLGVKKKL